MTDLIRREDAIEAMCDDCGGGQKYPTCDQVEWCSEVNVLLALPSAEAVQGWIPCSERLPDTDVEVLATVDWGDVRIAWLIKGGAWETEDYILDHDEILAWMPLPNPYKGGENE